MLTHPGSEQVLDAAGQFLPSAARDLAAAQKFQPRCILEPGGNTAFRSHCNSDLLIHPARGRWLLVSGAAGDAPAGCIFKSQTPKVIHCTGWLHCIRSHSNSNMLIHPARGQAASDPSTGKKVADGLDVVSFAG